MTFDIQKKRLLKFGITGFKIDFLNEILIGYE